MGDCSVAMRNYAAGRDQFFSDLYDTILLHLTKMERRHI